MGSVAIDSAAEAEVISSYINYYLSPKDGGTDVVSPGVAGDWIRKHESHKVEIRNMRQAPELTFDTAAFQLVSSLPAVELDKMETKDFTATIDLLKRTTSATMVIPFNHVVRKDTKESVEAEARTLPYHERGTKAGPAFWSHLDQSDKGAAALMKHIVPESELERLSKVRWAIVNVWRPLAPVLREPLAVCDARTLPEEDLRPTTIVHGDIKHIESGADGSSPAAKPLGELYQIAYRSTHKWWYAKEMQPDEALLLKVYDTKMDGRARRCAHSAFEFLDQDPNAPPRRSVEVRCLVFWENESKE